MVMPRIMGILNVTPDSFFDGGKNLTLKDALTYAIHLIEAGADIIDVGGESSRPGAHSISVQEELDRVMPVIEALHKETACSISIDTTKPEVMQAALSAGASMVNDINALRTEGALKAVSNTQCEVVLMHKQGTPLSMQDKPYYEAGVVKAVQDFFAERIQACEQAGIERKRLYLDPGFGFGKTLTHNLSLLARIDECKSWDLPLLIGVSRKSMLGQVVNKPVDGRLAAGLSVAVYAAMKGVAVIRTHDVSETHDAVMMLEAIKKVE